MPKKIFLSFLGAIPYKDAHYYWKQDKSDITPKTPYVQSAIISNCLPKWEQNDEIWIFTTEDAYTNNYVNRITRFANNRPSFDEGKGLQFYLAQLKEKEIIAQYGFDKIPNGYNEEEIWTIFQKVFEKIEPDSHIYFDITYGFRSLPMLGIVLMNFAKNIHKNVEIKAIFYGVYEAGRAEHQARLEEAADTLTYNQYKELERQAVEAPILDLLSFSVLQDWTSAAREFIKAGSTDSLGELVKISNPNLAQSLSQFEKAISTCRGQYITIDVNVDALKSIVALKKGTTIEKQLGYLLDKVEEKINPFENSKVLKNGFAAVEWCIQHNKTQQGITFLQETLVSFVIEKIAGKDKILEPIYREFGSGALNGFAPNRFRLRDRRYRMNIQEEMDYEYMYNFVRYTDDLSSLYKELTGKEGFRNDINHCGFKEDYLSPEELEQKLIDLFNNIKALNLE